MATPFHTVHNICLVVRDLDSTVAFYESIGVGPWHDYPPLTDYTDLDVPDHDGFRGLRFRYAPLGQIQLQLVEPGPGATPQRRHLDEHGEGVFHIAFVTASADEGERAAAELGLEPLMRGRRPDGSGFTYLDTAARAGGVVLLVRGNAPGDTGPAPPPRIEKERR
jgi:catechol 2,3-dioxygenase-like lactoylglutathione lyase family enzyme